MEENDKQQKDGLLGTVKKGLKKAVESISATFAQPEPGIISEENKKIIAEELVQRISAYYNGVTPDISDISISDNVADNRLIVIARVTNLHSASSGIHEAELQAEMEIPDANYYHVPVPGAYGIDAFPPAPLPIYDYKPRFSRITLEITNSNYRAEAALNSILESIKIKYPHAKLIDETRPVVLSNETLFCKRLVSDPAANSKGKNKNLLRLIKFPFKKVPVARMLDECLSIMDYEFQLQPPEELFTTEFPGPAGIKKILAQEKRIIRDQVFESIDKGFSNGLRKLFFRIGEPVIKIEANDDAAENEISLNIEFDCVSGLGPLSKASTISTVLYYAIDSGTGGKKGETTALRYIKRSNFITLPARY